MLVTGGARRIGAAIVRHLVGAGHRVAVHHHDSHDEAEALAAELGVALVIADLADAADTRGLVQAAAAALGGPVEGLVNNASLFSWDAVPVADYAGLDRHMHVNLGAPLVLASALAAQTALGDGAVVNLLDQKVANPNPDFLTYTLSKAALAEATRLLAMALAPRIRVNAVSPGLTLPSLDQSEDEFAQVSAANLLERVVEIEDIARTVEQLLTTRSITGQNVFVDCGQRFVRRDGDVMFETRERPRG
ncbi:SDR family oxidoreductase [Sphingomonas sp. BT-65]|uniref:SDR family oxidoreductase n=1 Tax=Sphingomonas sp. BT-65 TaxID=2989821 RepID=UPI00223550F7|nr:SDR family oxidoreductase [Sphingomonas sp. BT-65]MCW4462961.1 SDR family oxidoreductase [Sphingomonas sp. BT-65]